MTPTETPPAAPAMPYAVEEVPFGPSSNQRLRLVKRKPTGLSNGDVLTDDELAVLAYVRWLEGARDQWAEAASAAITERDRLMQELDASLELAAARHDALVPFAAAYADGGDLTHNSLRRAAELVNPALLAAAEAPTVPAPKAKPPKAKQGK